MDKKHSYIIGEIGQNHNGSVDIAKLLVDLVSRPVKEDLFGRLYQPMDAVKLTKRDLNEELSRSQMDSSYINEHSFGKTYGEHREYLELSDEEHFEVYKHAKLKGLDFVETFCAIGTLSILKKFVPDKAKIASRDLTNLPLLSAVAETKIPIIISLGMAGRKELDDALKVITKYHNSISILHCVSEYPAKPENVNLNSILFLKKKYPNYTIGYSDHTIGISAPVAAVALGAEIIEKHVTIDRRLKGTDQAGSLGPDGVNRMIRDIRVTELSLGKEDVFLSEAVSNAKIKLERSIASKCDMKKGDIITNDKIHMLSPGDGVFWRDRDVLIGKKLNCDVAKDELIYKNMV